jgi:putative Holliday junction resolvase
LNPVRPGVRLGVDVGSVRIGVARCDRDGLLATPLETVPRGDGDLARIRALVADHDDVEVIVGLPRNLSGAEGAAARDARTFADQLSRAVSSVAVRLVDERLTTVTATRAMRGAGVSQKAGRAVVDQAAAVIILQSALDAERATGREPGEAVP